MPTRVNAMNGSQLKLRFSNGDSPQTFSQWCIINTERGIEFTTRVIESTVPYCPPDEEVPAWVDRETDDLSASITGSGILDLSSLPDVWDWYESGDSKNIQVVYANDVSSGRWVGAGVLTSFKVTGPQRREKATFDCTIMSDGVWSQVTVTT